MNDKLSASRFHRVPLAEITTPKNGYRAVVGCWWAVTENDEVLFFVTKMGHRTHESPQFNSSRAVVEHLESTREIPTRAVQVPVAYLPEQPSEGLEK